MNREADVKCAHGARILPGRMQCSSEHSTLLSAPDRPVLKHLFCHLDTFLPNVSSVTDTLWFGENLPSAIQCSSSVFNLITLTFRRSFFFF